MSNEEIQPNHKFEDHEFSDGAIDALIAASLRHAYSSDPPSEASIADAIKAATIEEPEDDARLERIRQSIKEGPRPE